MKRAGEFVKRGMEVKFARMCPRVSLDVDDDYDDDAGGSSR